MHKEGIMAYIISHLSLSKFLRLIGCLGLQSPAGRPFRAVACLLSYFGCRFHLINVR